MIGNFSYTQLKYRVIRFVFFANLLALGAGIEAKEATDKVREFVHNETQATNALQSGVARLARLCATPLKPAESSVNSDALKDLTTRVQARSKALATVAEQQLNKIQEVLAASKQDQIQICSRRNWLNGPRGRTSIASLDGTCEAAINRVAEVESLRFMVSKWKEIHTQRQKLFDRLLSLESAQCTRAGFAQRMVQAHESALGKFEDDLPSWINEALLPEDATRTQP